MNEIYAAIYQRLVAQLTVNVYDHVPEDLPDSNYPFVRVDYPVAEEADTDLETGFTATVQIVAYSRYRGFKEVAEIAQQVYSVLHRWSVGSTANYGVTTIHLDNANTVTAPDGLTRHSVQRFNVVFEPLPVTG